MKKCTVCNLEKDSTQYNDRNGKKLPRCRECAKEYAKKYYRSHRAESLDKRKKYYEDHKEESLAKHKTRYEKKGEEIRHSQRQKAKTPENREKSRIRSLKWQKENKERFNKNLKKYRDKNKDKLKARQYVLWALKLQVIEKPDQCVRCGNMKKLQAHHEDYSQPLQVTWLCKVCHMHLHGKLLDIIPKENI